MQIGLLAAENSWYTKTLCREIVEAGHQAATVPFSSLCSQVQTASKTDLGKVSVTGKQPNDDSQPSLKLENCNAVIVRSMPAGSLEQIVFRMDALIALQQQGTLIVNSPKALECAIDKYLSLVRMQQSGLPIPETLCCESANDAMIAFEQLGRDVVVKPLFGSEGRGIVRVTDAEVFWRTARTLEQIQAVIYVQKFIPHAGYDFRVLVLDGKPLGTIRRRSTHDFRTNVAQRAIAERVDSVDPQIEQLAVDAAKSIDAQFAAVDVLLDTSHANSPVILEVNAVPGWRAFQKVTEINVAQKLIQSITTQLGET